LWRYRGVGKLRPPLALGRDAVKVNSSYVTRGGRLWFEDLSPCNYFPGEAKLVAVGWLECGKPYSTGTIDRPVYDALAEMRKNPWQPFACAGLHECDLCRFEPEVRGSANLFVPASGTIYVCPDLILHYVNAHGYAPPDVFCRAVRACPPRRSMQYLKAIKECGGARLLRPTGGEV
jgi:hypothetical protein